MTKEEKQERISYTREELLDVLQGVRELTDEELSSVFSGVLSGDHRKEFTLDAKEIETDIFGSKYLTYAMAED